MSTPVAALVDEAGTILEADRLTPATPATLNSTTESPLMRASAAANRDVGSSVELVEVVTAVATEVVDATTSVSEFIAQGPQPVTPPTLSGQRRTKFA